MLKQNKTLLVKVVVFQFLSRNRSMLRAKDRREKTNVIKSNVLV